MGKAKKQRRTINKAVHAVEQAKAEVVARLDQVLVEQAALTAEEGQLRAQLDALEEVLATFPPAPAPEPGGEPRRRRPAAAARPQDLTPLHREVLTKVVEIMADGPRGAEWTANALKDRLGHEKKKIYSPLLVALARAVADPACPFTVAEVPGVGGKLRKVYTLRKGKITNPLTT